MNENGKVFPGADEKSPSRPQYFSWINNTNEGATERQTLVNLRYFEWLKNTYGMHLEIYAWDAGNLDGASETYQSQQSPKIKAQFPNGYRPCAEAAARCGTRLGVWCGPDGFGKTKESEAARREEMISLCRDLHFELFKIDGVCGQLRVNKRKTFSEMMTECRRYSPDLILLNHRLSLGRGVKHATTFLWNGVETYVDVHINNPCTAPHHRAFIFSRGNVPGLKRLSEDHGVCLSSCMDNFTDDLIYQAFGRCLILAPEIYANPWLLKDSEQSKLARIYNLHARYADILVNGRLLPEEMGCNAVSRGSDEIRFITTGSDSWGGRDIEIKLDRTCYLKKCDRVFVSLHHPYEKVIGTFKWGDTVKIHIPAFRAVLIRLCRADLAPEMMTGCEYEVINEDENGAPVKVKLLSSDGDVSFKGKKIDAPAFDECAFEPVFLGEAAECPLPDNAAQMLEKARFAVDSNSLEYRSLERAGKTAVPEIRAARDEFFGQLTYKLRGCEAAAMFDADPATFFDAHSKLAFGGMRVLGGCLRIDFGKEYTADSVVIEYFNPDESREEILRQSAAETAWYSADLSARFESKKRESVIDENAVLPLVVRKVHNIVEIKGKKVRAEYPVNGSIRYFCMSTPVDRIFKAALIRNGKEIKLHNPTANNLLPAPEAQTLTAARSFTFTADKKLVKRGAFLAVALDGEHGVEGAVPVAEIGGRLYTFPDRAPSYPSNAWECPARQVGSNYTYYLPLPSTAAGKEIKVTLLKMNNADYPVRLWLCGREDDNKGKTIIL